MFANLMAVGVSDLFARKVTEEELLHQEAEQDL